MIFAYVLVIAVACFGWFGVKNGAEPRVRGWFAIDGSSASPAAAMRIALACASLVIAFVAVQLLDAHEAARAIGIAGRRVLIPLRVVVDGRPGGFASALAFCLALIETAALAWLALIVRSCDRLPRSARGVLIMTGAVLLAIAAFAPTATSSDIYAYVQQALSSSPYHPSGIAQRGDPILAALWSAPGPTPYGPLWIALSNAAVRPFAHLGSQLMALRGLALVAYVAAIFALGRLRAPVAAIACFALDPTFVQLFVVDAHNDIVALALVLWGCAAASLPVSIVLVAAAACVKLPYLVVGIAAFAAHRSARRRIAALGAASTLTALAYLAAAGPGYLKGLGGSGNSFVPPPPFFIATHLAAAALALALLAWALVRDRWIPHAGWSMLAFGFLPLPWYLASAFPYALRSRRAVGFLVLVPLVAALLSRTYLLDASVLGTICACTELGLAAWFVVDARRTCLARRREGIGLAASG